jgi:hypothetical protein
MRATVRRTIVDEKASKEQRDALIALDSGQHGGAYWEIFAAVCPNLIEALHLAIHRGMTMAVYPFWSDIATQVGRLLRLQGVAAAAHIQRRVREQFGERETVSRAARRILLSYLNWGVLQETGTMGIYCAAPSLAIEGLQVYCVVDRSIASCTG